jgi:hypothetical protein
MRNPAFSGHGSDDMTRPDTQAQSGMSEKVVRACPNNGLKEPVQKFEDTFSAETVLLKAFFPEK